ncbi:MAG: tetratricopeptide repeat protein [Anaerolineae bacterium]
MIARRQGLAFILLSSLLVTSIHCAPRRASTSTPTPAPDSEAGLAMHLLVESSGRLTHKRPGWQEDLPLSFGAILDRDDLLQVGSGAEGLVACADLSVASLPADYYGGLPCPVAEPYLVQKGSFVLGPRRSMAADSSIPYILSPRHTFLQSERPLLRWHPSESGTVVYTVHVWGDSVDWQTETSATELRYPDDAPALRPGVSYHLTVIDSDGHSSEEEKTALDLSFVLLSPDIEAAVQALVTQAQGLGLSQRAAHLLESQIYDGHDLRADAIALLEEMAPSQDAPGVYRRLGNLYLEVGLYTEAAESFDLARSGYTALGDIEGEAAALAGLGLAHRGDGDDATAREWLEQARDLYQRLGEGSGLAGVESVLDQVGP